MKMHFVMPNTPKMITQCAFIAEVAHTAQGQLRADGKTPYIKHPERVANLTATWLLQSSDASMYYSAVSAAWLHDIVEDTRVTLKDLRNWGVDARTVELVDLLTKKNLPHEPESEEYYQGIAHDDTACILKAADRCSNLEDALDEVKRGSIKRWKNYVVSTYKDVLPVYKTLPFLKEEIMKRLTAIESEILEKQIGGPVGVFDCGDLT